VRCTVWLARTWQVRPAHTALLDPTERGRRTALRREADRDRFTLAAAVLRLAAADAVGIPPGAVRVDRTCPDCGAPHGRPRLPGTGLHASVSHSGDLVAVALSPAGPVGIDVERVDATADLAALARSTLAPGEPLRAPGDLFTYWCRKESVVKATGEGLRVPLNEVLVGPAGRPPRLVSYRGRALTAAMTDLPAGPGYAAALTVLAAGRLEVDQPDSAALVQVVQKHWPVSLDASGRSPV
jgi:4'-phosphopantetheinyl transferase